MRGEGLDAAFWSGGVLDRVKIPSLGKCIQQSQVVGFGAGDELDSLINYRSHRTMKKIWGFDFTLLK